MRKSVDTSAMDPGTVALMFEEVRALAQLDSPFIVRIFEHAEETGRTPRRKSWTKKATCLPL